MSTVARKAKPPKSALAAFTLIELLLTLAVLITIVTLVVPSIESRLRGVELDVAQQQLYQRLMQTRTRAMDQGRTWTFLLENSATYKAFPTGNPDDALQWTLPDEVRFVASETMSGRFDSGTFDSGTVDSGTVAPIYFYSDGTCSETPLFLRHKTGIQSRVEVTRLKGVRIR